jgi:very-short-patch-repair endonuclease
VGEGARRADEGAATNTRLRGLARHLRKDGTEAEAQLWRLLRGRRFVGYKFRRQVPIGPYIADFVSYRPPLILELDGSQHAESERDLRRDTELQGRGFRVLRIWNNELTRNRQGVLEAIWSALHEVGVGGAPSSVSAPPIHLLPRGEKEEEVAANALPSPLVGEGARRADEGVATNTGLSGHSRTDGRTA